MWWRGLTRRLRWRAVRRVWDRAGRLMLRLLPIAPEDRSPVPGTAPELDNGAAPQDRAAAALLEWRARAAPRPPRHWLEYIEAAGRRFKPTWIDAHASAAGPTVVDTQPTPAEHRPADPRREPQALEFPPVPVRPARDDSSRRSPAPTQRVFIRHEAPSQGDPAATARIVDPVLRYPSDERSGTFAGALEPPRAEGASQVREGRPHEPPSERAQSAMSDPPRPPSPELAQPEPVPQGTSAARADSSRRTTPDPERRDSRLSSNSGTDSGAPVAPHSPEIEPVSYPERSSERGSSFSPAMQFERLLDEPERPGVAPVAVGPQAIPDSPWPELTRTPLPTSDDAGLDLWRREDRGAPPMHSPLAFGAVPPHRSWPVVMDTSAPAAVCGGSVEDTCVLDTSGESSGRWPTLPGTSSAIHEDWRAIRRRLERLDRLDREQRGA